MSRHKDIGIQYLTRKLSLINLGAQININIPYLSTSIKATVIDIDNDNQIILKVAGSDFKNCLSNGSSVSVRFLYNGISYVFTTVVTAVILEPINLIIVEYPENIELYNTRRYKRVDCILPIKVKSSDETLYDGTVINISLGGCQLLMKNIYDANTINPVCLIYYLEDTIQLIIQLPEATQTLNINGTVRSVHSEGYDKYYGIEFTDMDTLEKQTLTTYIHTIETVEQESYFLYTLHSILQILMDRISFEEQLDKILSLILSIPNLSLQAKGCLYILDRENNTLLMKASRGLDKQQVAKCKNLSLGKCLCGLAASKKELIFADCIDHRHTITYEKMIHHGHYCLPIMAGDNVLGVINLYIKEGYKRDSKVENYLISVSNALAGLIERKNAETEKDDYYNKLQETLEQLKRSQESLVQSEKMRSLSQLVAGIAHEINNPLGFLNSNNDNIKKFVNKIIDIVETYNDYNNIPQEVQSEINNLKEEIKYEYIVKRIFSILERSSVGIQRIKDIVLKLKTYSRIDKAEILDVDINDSIDITLDLLRYEYNNKGSIVKNYGSLPLVKCYGAQLNNVFMNILKNAFHYIDDSGKITVTTRLTESNMVHIEISDTGNGIPVDILDKVFDPFFTTKDVGEGTGLGLSTSRSIIERHKGQLYVNSIVGKGSSFVIKLPTQPL